MTYIHLNPNMIQRFDVNDNDPRLIDTRTGIRYLLNILPRSDELSLQYQNEYINSLPNIKTLYKNYDEIQLGQINYYDNTTINIPFIQELFLQKNNIVYYPMITPMDVSYDVYLYSQDNKDIRLKKFSPLQSMNDNIIYRENMMASYLIPRNKRL